MTGPPGDGIPEGHEAEASSRPEHTSPDTRRRRFWTGCTLAGFVWGLLLAVVAALYAAGEGRSIDFGRFRFQRGTTGQLTRDLLLVFLGVVLLHGIALGAWLAWRRFRPPSARAPDGLQRPRRGARSRRSRSDDPGRAEVGE